jgi:hypothetical protein
MRTFAQKQNQTQGQASSNVTRSRIRPSAASQELEDVPHLQRTPAPHEAGSDSIAPARFAHDFSRIPVHSKIPAMLQMKCACGSRCSECQSEPQSYEHLQRKPVGANDSGGIAAPPIVHKVLSTSGHPMSPATRGFMESRFGQDFSQVRLHTDEKAAESAHVVGALAYTVGRDIAFATGQYAPETRSGQRLLAHELTHVVQQRGHRGILQAYSIAGAADDIHEREAEQRADDVAGGPAQADDSSPAQGRSQQKGCSKEGGCKNGKWEFEYDGCSLPAFVAKSYGVDPDNPAGGADTQFGTCSPGGKACDGHDECYQTYGADKEKCDSVMKDDMLAICHASKEKPRVKERCYFWAKKYFWGLGTRFAGKAFNDRQAQVGQCK